MRRVLHYLLLCAAASVAFISCDKKESESEEPEVDPNPPTPAGETVLLSAAAVTSSSVSLGWSGGLPASGWKLYIYKDSECTEQVKCVSIPSSAAKTAGDTAEGCITVGGLDSGTPYWFKMEDADSHQFTEVLSATVDEFSPLVAAAAVTGYGPVLAEDFSEFRFGPDPFSGAGGLSADGAFIAAGEDGQGLSDWTESQAGSRLASWSGEAFGVEFNSVHPGYLKLGSIASGGWICTPVFDIADGLRLTMSVTVKAARESEDNYSEWAVFVVDSRKVFDWPDTHDASRYREIPIPEAGQWKECSVEGLSVSTGDRIVFGRKKGVANTGGRARVLLSEISVTAVETAALEASLSASTSSTLSITWTAGISPADDASRSFMATLYSDEAGNDIVQEIAVPAGTCGSSASPKLIFAGLAPGTTYYFRAADTGSGERSALVPVTTEPFDAVVMPEKVLEPGVILAEDFGELRWESDPVTGSAGTRPSDFSSFTNGPGGIVALGADASQELKLLSGALAESRLDGWAIDSYGYVRPGAVQLGKSGKKGWLLTPEIPENIGSAKVNVTIKAATMSNTAANIWCIGVLDRANANVTGHAADFNHHPDASDASKIQHFTLSSSSEWQTITASGLVVSPGDRIFFGVKASYSVSGLNCSALVSECTVEAATVYPLEDPLVFSDGTPVTSASQWADRRSEILDIFQQKVYGLMPEKLTIYPEAIESGETAVGSQAAVRKQVRMWFNAEHTGQHVDWLIVRPKNAAGKVPVIMTLNYVGNHAFLPDTEVLIPDAWQENWADYGVSDNRAQESGRGSYLVSGKKYYYPMEEFLSRGYAFVTACQAEISPDPEDPAATTPDRYGLLFNLFGPRDPSHTNNTGALMLWGWTLMRGLDMIEGEDALDAERVIVTGSSRLGKAALIAGAFDQRFAAVVPVQTGGGGTPLTKHISTGKETISSETGSYPHWWCKAYSGYAGKENTMPFDQHLLLSCIAPRHLLVLGFNHKWFDTEGEYFSVRAASPVWSFLGGEGMPDVAWPATGSTVGIGRDLGYARRAGDTSADHGVNQQDWNWIYSFCDNL